VHVWHARHARSSARAEEVRVGVRRLAAELVAAAQAVGRPRIGTVARRVGLAWLHASVHVFHVRVCAGFDGAARAIRIIG